MTPAMSPAPNFDGLARPYRWMEVLTFGPWLWRCRCAFLDAMKASTSAMVLGDGDGRFTARLLDRNPAIRVDAVDISRTMLEVLRGRAGHQAGRVRAQVADARTWVPEGDGRCYDLVVTHFLLDCLTTDEVEGLAARIRPHLTPDAMWVVSEFAVPAGWYGSLVARPVVGALYRAFGWMTGLRVRRLPDYEGALNRAGFRIRSRRNWLGGLLVSECWAGSGPGDRSA
jgi:SAM-dependent methyltransferase